MARRHFERPCDSRRYFDWLERAAEDMTSARLLRLDEGCYNNAAFHCQQAIEKALKAYILLKSNHLVDGHNLSWLCKRAVQYDKKFSEWLSESASLNKCYIETRYPADLPLDIEYDDVTKYYQMAREMYEFICREVDAALASKQTHPGQNGG